MANQTYDGRREFPQLEAPQLPGPQLVSTAVNPDVGLDRIGASAREFGAQLGVMVEDAAKREGEDAATKDALKGTLHPVDDSTTWGKAYRHVAVQAKANDFTAAMVEQTGKAYAQHQDDPEALDKALGDVVKGLGTTGDPESDLLVAQSFKVRRADLMGKAQLGLQQKTVQASQAGFLSTAGTQGTILDQAASGASFDDAGAAQVSTATKAYVLSLARFGPPEAFKVGDIDIPADPNRQGLISPAVIAQTAMAGVTQAKKSWILNAADRIPTADGKRAFLADVHKRWQAGDPAFAGLQGDDIDGLTIHIEGEANKADVKERQGLEDHATKARNMITAWQWGADVDPKAMLAEAQASGDPGLIAQASFYIETPQFTKGVLKSVVAQQAGITGQQGGGVEWVNGAGVPVAGANPVADDIRSSAQGLGASPADQNYLVRAGVVESNLDPKAQRPGSQYSGAFQFPGGAKGNVQEQTAQAYDRLKADRAYLKGVLGRDPTYGELYLAHQQGPAGAKALLTAPPEVNVVAALTPAYMTPGVSQAQAEAKARAAVVNNGGDPNGTAGQFVAHVKGYFAGNPKGGAWTPPPGMQPGTPAYAAWASTKEGFTSDPLAFARGNATRAAIADVPVLVPDAAFTSDAGQLGAWGDALRKRQALGATLAATFGVPHRYLTNGEADYYRSRIKEDPANAVRLAQMATGALGPDGARRFMREISGPADGNTAMYLGQLAIGPSHDFAETALQGMRVKAEGGHISKTDGDDLDKAFDPYKGAFAVHPEFITQARNVAELAMISDQARGIKHSAGYYAQSAIGATNFEGSNYGGAAKLNGVMTPVPGWYNPDHHHDVMMALGERWVSQGTGPHYEGGRPLRPDEIAKSRLVPLPNGRYALTDQTGRPYRDNKNGPFTLDLEGAKPFLTQRFGRAVVLPQ